MSSLAPDGEPQRPAAMVYTPQDDVHERLKALELQLTLEAQRRRDQFEEALHKLHRLSQDVGRAAQHAEAQTSRAVERQHHELLETLFERDHTTVQRHMLGELFMTLGRQLQEDAPGEGS